MTKKSPSWGRGIWGGEHLGDFMYGLELLGGRGQLLASSGDVWRLTKTGGTLVGVHLIAEFADLHLHQLGSYGFANGVAIGL